MSSQTAIYHDDNKFIQNRYSEQVILKVLNSDNNNTIAIDNNNYSIIYNGSKRHLVICNSCFWCASLYSDSRTVKCPLCNSNSNQYLKMNHSNLIIIHEQELYWSSRAIN